SSRSRHLVSFTFRHWQAPRPTLFPYTTLFRSAVRARESGKSTSSYVISCPGSIFLFIYTWSINPMGTWRGCSAMVTVSPRNSMRSEEHTSELQSRENLVCRLLLEKKKRTEY